MILTFEWDGDGLTLDRSSWDERLKETQRPLPPPEKFTEDIFRREERRFTSPPAIAIFAEELVDPIRAKRLDVLNELRALRDNRKIDRDEYPTQVRQQSIHEHWERVRRKFSAATGIHTKIQVA